MAEAVLVDLGSGGSVDLNLPRAIIADQDALMWFQGTSAITMFGELLDTTYIFETEELKLGDRQMPGSYVFAGSPQWASIGNRFLSSYRVILSWHKQELFLDHIDAIDPLSTEK